MTDGEGERKRREHRYPHVVTPLAGRGRVLAAADINDSGREINDLAGFKQSELFDKSIPITLQIGDGSRGDCGTDLAGYDKILDITGWRVRTGGSGTKG
jgi:hypothetical protein